MIDSPFIPANLTELERLAVRRGVLADAFALVLDADMARAGRKVTLLAYVLGVGKCRWMNQRQLAAALGVSEKRISRTLSKLQPSVEMLLAGGQESDANSERCETSS